MDKYAPYVWSAYSVALGLLALLSAGVLWRLMTSKKKLSKLQEEDAE